MNSKYTSALSGTPEIVSVSALRSQSAFMRLVDKLNGMVGIQPTVETAETIEMQKPRFPKISAASVGLRISKYVRQQSRAMEELQAILVELDQWLGTVLSIEHRHMISLFCLMAKAQRQAEIDLVNQWLNVKMQLATISEREQTLRDLVTRRARLIKTLRECETKLGPHAKKLYTLCDLLEVNYHNIVIVDLQFQRSVARCLRQALEQYTVFVEDKNKLGGDLRDDVMKLCKKIEEIEIERGDKIDEVNLSPLLEMAGFTKITKTRRLGHAIEMKENLLPEQPRGKPRVGSADELERSAKENITPAFTPDFEPFSSSW